MFSKYAKEMKESYIRHAVRNLELALSNELQLKLYGRETGRTFKRLVKQAEYDVRMHNTVMG